MYHKRLVKCHIFDTRKTLIDIITDSVRKRKEEEEEEGLNTNHRQALPSDVNQSN